MLILATFLTIILSSHGWYFGTTVAGGGGGGWPTPGSGGGGFPTGGGGGGWPTTAAGGNGGGGFPTGGSGGGWPTPGGGGGGFPTGGSGGGGWPTTAAGGSGGGGFPTGGSGGGWPTPGGGGGGFPTGGSGGGGWPTTAAGGSGGGGFPTGGSSGGWPTPGGGGGGFPTGGSGGGGWPTTAAGGSGGGGFPTGGSGGGWPTPGSGGGGGGWPTPGGGGGGFPTPGSGGGGFPTPGGGGGGGGGWPTQGPGGWFPVMTPGSSCGSTAPSEQDMTCVGNGGQCMTSCEVWEDTDESLECSDGQICCLIPVLPEFCGNPYLSRSLYSSRGSARIVGGSEAEAHSWPWQVSLQNIEEFHYCGGVLITDQWVLTAAHCVEGQSTVYNVVLGEHDRNEDSGREVYRQGEVFVHEDYKSGAPYPNDIALLKLNEPVELSSIIFPACVPEPGTEFDTSVDECWLSGWGDTKGTGDESMLNEIRKTVTPNDVCLEKWGEGCILETNICIGNGETGACNGDSGGPLSCIKAGESRWQVAGLTSWGYNGCQTEGYPNVYTRVSEYKHWIEAVIRKNI